MASVTDGAPRRGGRRGSGTRGQMLLIGAFVLAVTFVGLALIVNSAIFTENLASRSDAGGADDALEGRHAVVRGVGDAMARANVHNNSDWSNLTDSVTGAADTVGRSAAREYALDGHVIAVEATGHEEGTRIADEVSGGSTFESANGTSDWTVVQTSHTRAFTMSIDRDELLAGGDTFGGDPSDEFRVNVTDGTNRWRVNVTDRSDTFVVGVRPPGGGGGTCAVPESVTHVSIDLTRGTVAGRECPAMTFREGVTGPYDVTFNGSDHVVGNYSLVVDADGYGSADLQPGPDVGADDDPYADLAIYSSTLRYSYDAPSVRYATDVRVAPGEPR